MIKCQIKYHNNYCVYLVGALKGVSYGQIWLDIEVYIGCMLLLKLIVTLFSNHCTGPEGIQEIKTSLKKC